MTPEGKVRAHLRKTAIAAGFEHRKLRWIGRRGAPDELLFWPEGGGSLERQGNLLQCLVEVKAPGVEVDWRTPQGREIVRLRKAGWRVYVINSIAHADEVVSYLTSLAKST